MINANEVMALIQSRRSVRRFKDEPVDRETIARLIEAATWAPTAGNRQDWEFTVVLAETVRQRMAEVVQTQWERLLSDCGAESVAEEFKRYARNFDWFARAPVVIAVSAKRPEGFLYYLAGEAAADIGGGKASAAMAAHTLMLAAHSMGLGSCCLTGPLAAQDALREILGLGQRREIVCLIALGWPAEIPQAPKRKNIEEVMRVIE